MISVGYAGRWWLTAENGQRDRASEHTRAALGLPGVVDAASPCS